MARIHFRAHGELAILVGEGAREARLVGLHERVWRRHPGIVGQLHKAASTFAVLDIRAYCWSPENCAVIGSGTSSLVIQVNWPAELVNKSAESPVAPSSDETETLAPAIICGGEVVVSSTPFTVTSPPG